jgi:hypothetical protein
MEWRSRHERPTAYSLERDASGLEIVGDVDSLGARHCPTDPTVEFDDAIDYFGAAVVGPVGGWCAMRRLGQVDPASFGGDSGSGDYVEQVPPGGCDGRGHRHLKEHCPGAGHLDGQVH